MGHRHIKICDRCKAEGEEVDIFPVKVSVLGWDYVGKPHKADWCRKCIVEMGLRSAPTGDAELKAVDWCRKCIVEMGLWSAPTGDAELKAVEPTEPTTLEDVVREIVRDEIESV